MNEFDQMFNEIKERWPQITPEQFGQACKNVLAAAEPHEQVSIDEISQRVRKEILRLTA